MNYNDKLSARDVQELAGHANLNTTFGYVHPSKERINKHAASLFNTFSRDEIYKNGEDILKFIANFLDIKTKYNLFSCQKKYLKYLYQILYDKDRKSVV